MDDDKRMTRKVYEGEVVPTKVLGVTVKSDAKTAQSYAEAVENLGRAVDELKAAIVGAFVDALRRKR